MMMYGMVRYGISQQGRDYALSVSRRFGFASFPACVLVLRVVWQAVIASESPWKLRVALVGVLWLVLLALKCLLSVVLLGHSAKHLFHLSDHAGQRTQRGGDADDAGDHDEPPSSSSDVCCPTCHMHLRGVSGVS